MLTSHLLGPRLMEGSQWSPSDSRGQSRGHGRQAVTDNVPEVAQGKQEREWDTGSDGEESARRCQEGGQLQVQSRRALMAVATNRGGGKV